MHFGAASMIWPMEWGKAAGSKVFLVFIGAFITSLFLVVLSYIALSKADGNFTEASRLAMGEKGGQYFSLFTVTVLCFYGVPRMSAAVWDAFLQVSGYVPASRLPLIVFTVLFFAIAYVFLITPGKVMDRISKILFPILIVVVVLIIGKGLINPISTFSEPAFSGNPIAYGFTQGYSTAEIICALIFGVVILNNLKQKGVPEERMDANIIKVGVAGIGILTCTHLGNMIIGSTAGPEVANLSYIQLYTQVASILLGRVGGVAFVIAALMAALTTAVGIGSATGEFYETASNGKLKYRNGALVCMVFSAVMGSMGLTSLLTYVGPFLDAVYPATIILVLHFSLMPNCKAGRKLNACKWSMYLSLVFGVCDIVKAYSNMGIMGQIGDMYLSVYSKLPLYSAGLAWLPFAAAAYIAGYVLYKEKEREAAQ